MGIITGLIGLPALIKQISEMKSRIETLESEVESLKRAVDDRVRKLK